MGQEFFRNANLLNKEKILNLLLCGVVITSLITPTEMVSGKRADLIPLVDYIRLLPDGRMMAYFGYQNNTGEPIDLPRGEDNFLSVKGFISPEVPQSFHPGTFHQVFTITVKATSVTWTLTGNSATASRCSKTCPPPTPITTVTPTPRITETVPPFTATSTIEISPTSMLTATVAPTATETPTASITGTPFATEIPTDPITGTPTDMVIPMLIFLPIVYGKNDGTQENHPTATESPTAIATNEPTNDAHIQLFLPVIYIENFDAFTLTPINIVNRGNSAEKLVTPASRETPVPSSTCTALIKITPQPLATQKGTVNPTASACMLPSETVTQLSAEVQPSLTDTPDKAGPGLARTSTVPTAENKCPAGNVSGSEGYCSGSISGGTDFLKNVLKFVQGHVPGCVLGMFVLFFVLYVYSLRKRK